jgi:glutamine synthetase
MEKTETSKKAIETLKANNIRWVHSTFVDVRGILQDMVLPSREYLNGSAFNEGIGFDGSSVRGFKSIEESDMIFMPDPKTLAVMPWVTDEKQKSAIILGDVYEALRWKRTISCRPKKLRSKKSRGRSQSNGVHRHFRS